MTSLLTDISIFIITKGRCIAMTNEQIVTEIRKHDRREADLYQRLYEQNITLLKDFCKPYLAFSELDDLLQECYFGLIDAVSHYESSANVLFMTYSRFWIDRSLRLYIQNCCALYHLPQHYNEKIPKYKRFIKKFESEHDRKPTDDEIIKTMHIRRDTLEVIQQFLMGSVSINTPLKEDEELTLEDTISDNTSIEDDTVDRMYSDYEKAELWQTVDDFTNERQGRVLRYLFINGYTLQKVGDIEGLSRERVRQIREQALKRLKQAKAKRRLCERLEVLDSAMYRGGLNSYKEHVNTSITERLAVENTDIKQGLTKAS